MCASLMGQLSPELAGSGPLVSVQLKKHKTIVLLFS